jgi:hypothetical protein
MAAGGMGAEVSGGSSRERYGKEKAGDAGALPGLSARSFSYRLTSRPFAAQSGR